MNDEQIQEYEEKTEKLAQECTKEKPKKKREWNASWAFWKLVTTHDEIATILLRHNVHTYTELQLTF